MRPGRRGRRLCHPALHLTVRHLPVACWLRIAANSACGCCHHIRRCRCLRRLCRLPAGEMLLHLCRLPGAKFLTDCHFSLCCCNSTSTMQAARRRILDSAGRVALPPLVVRAALVRLSSNHGAVAAVPAGTACTGAHGGRAECGMSGRQPAVKRSTHSRRVWSDPVRPSEFLS